MKSDKSLSPFYYPSGGLTWTAPGRYCDLVSNHSPSSTLAKGMDFRNPRFRRETFLRFYEFHLKYRSHPGCVYFLIPELAKEYHWDDEALYWFSFLNGNTQNPVTSLLIFRRFPELKKVDIQSLRSWFSREYNRLQFDIDRRYQKTNLVEAIEYYKNLIGSMSQRVYFEAVASQGFENLFKLTKGFAYFGRLSAWSYLEYLRIIGLNTEPTHLALRDLSGSKSHRNGLCRVLGRDDLDWHKTNPLAFSGKYSEKVMGWLEEEAQNLLTEARQRSSNKSWGRDCSFFTLESALCTYKSWHRPNRRYPNVYADMLYERIARADKEWPEENLDVFWEIRRRRLPTYLRLESVTGDPGLSKEKQNHYLLTGCPVMMDRDWDCFSNPLNDGIREGSLG